MVGGGNKGKYVNLLFPYLQLLQKEASKRLGSGPGGSNEIKNHKWFKSINWRKLEAREIQPSFRPNVADKICVANFEERWTSMPLTVSPVASPVGASGNFNGFSYVKPSFLQKPSPLSWTISVPTCWHTCWSTRGARCTVPPTLIILLYYCQNNLLLCLPIMCKNSSVCSVTSHD